MGLASINYCIAAACIAMACASAALAQQPSSLEKRWPGDPEPAPPSSSQPSQDKLTPAERLQRSQQPTQQPAAAPAPPPVMQAPAAAAETQPPAAEARQAAPQKPKPRPPQPSHVVTCAGMFGKEASQSKLAVAFGANNVTWAEVDGPDQTKLNATVLFPRDPKQRLEVLWNSESARSDAKIVAINGQSTWTAPKGVKLGMTLAAVEKLNGKPLSLHGFKGESGGLATSWNGGALDTLPGDCRIGMRFVPDPKAPAPASGEIDVLTSEQEFLSNAPTMKPLAPKVAEIIVGY